jgi:benzodiazapine receptor
MPAATTNKPLLGLIAWLLLSAIASGLGAIGSMNAASLYSQMAQPAWAPPSAVFAPVWTVLYGLMAIAAWLVWRVGGWRQQRTALTLFVVQLVVNGLWSWLFFAWRQGAGSVVDIAVLWVLIVATTVLFWRVRPLAGALLLPYLAWVSFAAVLNHAVWQLNPQLLG